MYQAWSKSALVFLMFRLFVHIIGLFYRQVCFISKWLVGVEVNNKICSRHDIAEDTNGAIRIRISKNRQHNDQQRF
jgi:hypothetical protein